MDSQQQLQALAERVEGVGQENALLRAELLKV
jgi:hypothetical protein